MRTDAEFRSYDRTFWVVVEMSMNNRNYGIDAARLFAMLLVVVWHYVMFGGVLWAATPDRPLVYYFGRWLAALSVCCVDLFALVSGYVGVATAPRWKRFGELWLQVAVTALIVTVAVKLHGLVEVGFKDWLGCVMPVSRCTYWYFTAYAGVFLLMPILNMGIKALSRVQALTICGGGMFLFSFLTIPARAEFWYLNKGYSMLWLLLLYVFGGCLRLHVNLRGMAWIWICLGIACSFVTFFCGCWSPIPNCGQFLCYLNPSVVGSAACFLIGFSKLSISAGGAKFVTVVAPASFGVYLWHVHPLAWKHYWWGAFTDVAALQGWVVVVSCIVVPMAVFAGLLLLEEIRILIFKRIGRWVKQ